MTDEKHYSGRQVNRILRSILNDTKKKKLIGDGYTYSDIAATAGELGISRERLDRALADRQKRREDAKLFIKKHIKVGVAAVILLGVLAYFFWPTPFTGSVKMIFTTQVNDNFTPQDDLSSFSLFYNKKVYCFLTIFDIHNEHTVKCVFYDPKHKPATASELTITDPDGTKNAYFSLDLFLSSPTGVWTAEVYVDNTLQAEKTFTVTRGNYTVTLTSDVDKNDDPIDSLTTFSQSKHNRVVCYINWSKIKGDHLVEWHWINPSGELAQTDSIRITDQGGGNWAYYSLYLKGKPTGTWRVELIMDSVTFGERDFKIVP